MTRISEAEMTDLETDIERLLRGIQGIQRYLEENPPRVGDALFDCEALLAGAKYEDLGGPYVVNAMEPAPR